MNAKERIIYLVDKQNSSDNSIRSEAETEFNALSNNDPDKVILTLTEKSIEEDADVIIRQSCLLHLKRLVPRYWSLAFQSFIGPPVNQELKKIVRKSLIELVSRTESSKLRSGASYAIIQIAASDFPDEWPELMSSLYQLAHADSERAVVGGLTVLNELFDDLITEEQFWEQGIGSEITGHLSRLLSDPSMSLKIKIAGIKLYQSILNTLQSPEAYVNDDRKRALHSHVEGFFLLITNLLSESTRKSSELNLDEFYFRTILYKVMNGILGHFSKKIPIDSKKNLMDLSLSDFNLTANCYHSLVVLEDLSQILIPVQDYPEPQKTISDLVVELLQTISNLQNFITMSENMGVLGSFSQNLISCGELPASKVEQYSGDFNDYVTEITGLSVTSLVRETINDLLSEFNEVDSEHIFNIVFGLLELSDSNRWQVKECYLFMLGSLFSNTDLPSPESAELISSMLYKIKSFISFDDASSEAILLTCRAFLVLPSFFERFETIISPDLATNMLLETVIAVANYTGPQEQFNLVKVAMLVSCTYYKNLLDLSKTIPDNQKPVVQESLIHVICSLIEEGEEDTLPVLLEAATTAIQIGHETITKILLPGQGNIVDLILRISFKDPANLQMIVDSSECLKELFKDVPYSEYLILCEKPLVFIVTILKKSFDNNDVKYSPELSLALDFLSIIIDSAPLSPGENDLFPKEAFLYTFPVLSKLVILCTDDQILQTTGEVFNKLLEKASDSFTQYSDVETGQTGIDLLMLSVSKFLSPDLSDTAAMNCGLIVSSLIKKFQNILGVEYLLQTLEATVKRLTIAKEVIITENLIMVFCDLILSSTVDTINFLSDSLKIQDPESGNIKTGLELVLPIWFQSFEVTRGYEKIRQNALALARIFGLNDARIKSVLVNGKLIPYSGERIRTRSYTKENPDEYEQIPAPLKILNLLITELKFQIQQPDPSGYLPQTEESNDGNEEDWEDMDDIGVPNYEKLKSYVDSDSEDDDHEDQNGDQGLREILIQFFKECTSKNLGDFSSYYQYLTDEEKKIVTEALVF